LQSSALQLIASARIKKERGITRALCRLMLLGCTSLTFIQTANAASQIQPPQLALYESAPEAERVNFLITMAKSGQQAQAGELIARYPLRGPHAANRTLYINGLIMAANGNLTGAAKNYRAALADDPKLTLVRSELAQTLVALNEDDSAKHHLQLLEADAPDAADAANIRSFIDRIDAKRPYTISGYLSVAPSTNINGGSSHKTVYSPVFGEGAIAESGQKHSGVGASAGVDMGYSKRLSDDWQAVFAAGLDTRLYANSDYNSYSLSQSAELRAIIDKGYIGVGLVANQAVDPLAHSFTFHSYGPRLSLKYQLGQKDRLDGSTLYEWRNYAHSTIDDATASISNLAWSHAFDSTFTVGLSAGFDKVTNGNVSQSYKGKSIGANIYKELPFGISVNANAQAKFTNYDGINILASLVPREDQRYIGSVTLTKRDFNILGFAPSVNYTYARNKSNIAFYDNDSHSVDFRLTKDF
jgi:outer membrane protein